jgi:hypothetical protein
MQGSARRSAFLVAMRPSYSHSHASWDASGSSAGEMVRRATATHLSACGAENASKEARHADAPVRALAVPRDRRQAPQQLRGPSPEGA